MRRRLSRVALALALVAVGLLSGAASWVAYRRTRLPLVVFESQVRQPYVRFLDGGKLVLVQWHNHGDESDGIQDEVRSAADGTLLRTIEARDPWASSEAAATDLVVFWHSKREALPEPGLVRLLSVRTGRAQTIDFGRDVAQAELSCQGDVVAICDSAGQIEVRATRDGSLVRRLEPPAEGWSPEDEPQPQEFFLGFSPDGLLLGVEASWSVAVGGQVGLVGGPGPSFSTERQGSTRVYSLRDGSIGPVISIGFCGFTDRSEVVGLPIDIDTRHKGPCTIHSTEGELLRRIDEIGEFPRFTSGAPCFTTQTPLEEREAIDVRSLETRELLRRVLVPEGRSWRTVRLSPAGDRLAVGYEGGRVEIWAVPP